MQVHRSLGRSGLTLRNFTTKTACITGATSGIGKAYAEEFYQKGYSLGLIGRRLEGLQNLKRELEKEKVNASQKTIIVRGDLNQRELSHFRTIFEELISQIEQTPDIWINNAGNSVMGPLYLQTEEELEVQLNVHILATSCFSRLFLKKAMEEEKHRRFILINTSSVNQYLKPAYLSVYNATKSYIDTFSQTLGKEMENLDKNIQIVVTTPGPVDTKLIRGLHFKENLVVTPAEHVRGVIEEIGRNEAKFIRIAGSDKHEEVIRAVLKGEDSEVGLEEDRRTLETYFKKMKKGVKVV